MAREKKSRQLPRLRELRERAGLTQRKLAELAHVGRDTIRTIEGGREAWPRTAAALAEALGVTEEDLAGHPGFPAEQITDYLEALAQEQKTLYDAETAGMTDAELAAYVRRDPVLRRITGAIHKADEERRQLQTEQASRAG